MSTSTLKDLNDIIDKYKDFNCVIPKPGYFHSFFQNNVSGIGRSVQGLITDINKCENPLKYSNEFLNAYHNFEIEICYPRYIWFHSKVFIDTLSIKKDLSECNVSISDFILVNPIKRNIYEMDTLEKTVFDSFNEIEDISTVINKLSQSIPHINPKEIIEKWENNGIIRFSLTKEVIYHSIVKKNLDYKKHPLVLHNIADYPELKFFRIVITENCSLNCVYCYYADHYDVQRKTITEEKLYETIDNICRILKDSHKQDVCIQWWGGDPAEEEQLVIKGTEYAKEIFRSNNINVKFSICSSFVSNNSKEFFDYILKNNFNITISMDGTKECHNYNKPYKNGGESFEDVMRSRNYLAKNFPCISKQLDGEKSIQPKGSIKSRCTLFYNTDKFNEICEHFNSFDQSYRICMVSDTNSIQNKKEYRTEIIKLIKKYQQLAIEVYVNRLPYSKLSPIISNAITNPLNGLRFIYARCGFGGGIIIVNPTGQIYTCHRFCDIEDLCIGNIKDCTQTIIDKILKLRKRWNLSYDKCEKCNLKSLCTGGCAHESYELNGTIWKTAACIDIELIKNKVLLYYLFQKLYPQFIDLNLNIEDCSCVRNLWC